MAIAIGSRVALKNLGSSPLVIGQVNAQPVLFGTSETAAPGPCVIDWDNGDQATVPVAVLDEILVANNTTLDLVGKVVNVAGQASAYTALVVSAYNRNGSQQCVLVKTLQNGAYFELDATTVTAVPGQN